MNSTCKESRFYLFVFIIIILVNVYFLMNLCRWLDVNEDDGLIMREITTGGSQMLSSKIHSCNLIYT